jgi:hypothetical protein
VNGDGVTNDRDLFLVFSDLSKAPAARNLNEDLNADGQVTVADLDVVKSNYLGAIGATAPALAFRAPPQEMILATPVVAEAPSVAQPLVTSGAEAVAMPALAASIPVAAMAQAEPPSASTVELDSANVTTPSREQSAFVPQSSAQSNVSRGSMLPGTHNDAWWLDRSCAFETVDLFKAQVPVADPFLELFSPNTAPLSTESALESRIKLRTSSHRIAATRYAMKGAK